jgi:hypothetical protein
MDLTKIITRRPRGGGNCEQSQRRTATESKPTTSSPQDGSCRPAAVLSSAGTRRPASLAAHFGHSSSRPKRCCPQWRNDRWQCEHPTTTAIGRDGTGAAAAGGARRSTMVSRWPQRSHLVGRPSQLSGTWSTLWQYGQQYVKDMVVPRGRAPAMVRQPSPESQSEGAAQYILAPDGHLLLLSAHLGHSPGDRLAEEYGGEVIGPTAPPIARGGAAALLFANSGRPPLPPVWPFPRPDCRL